MACKGCEYEKKSCRNPICKKCLEHLGEYREWKPAQKNNKEENPDSPATPVQQLKEAISLLNRWMDDPDEDRILRDTYYFVSNTDTASV